MRRVCVVGGGRAGTEAAIQAAEDGVRVTLFEKSCELQVDEADWLDLPDPHRPSRGTSEARLSASGVETRLGEAILAIHDGCRVEARTEAGGYGAVVVATGSRCVREPLKGSNKPGVRVFDSRGSYATIERCAESMETPVITGGGLLALRLAHRLSGRGRTLTILSSRACLRGFAPGLDQMIRVAAKLNGVTLLDERSEGIVGTDAAEAVVAAGRVIPCDGVFIVPQSVAETPKLGARMSCTGRVMVDDFLATDLPGIFGAGDCAQLEAGGALQGAFSGATASGSGRVAGANAAGRRLPFIRFRHFSTALFGLRVGCAGLTLSEALEQGFGPCFASKLWGPDSGCWILFDRASSRVLGIQTAGETATSCLDSVQLAVSQGTQLSVLSRPCLLGSTDISPIAQAVREGLAHG